jgi:dipeptidyl aminopeptidase/acylaminoacyl peptidase
LQKRITNMNAQLKDYKLPEQKVISWKYDGVELEAVVTLPVGYEKGKKYPTILHVHGGPYGRVRNSLSGSWQVFAANGYAVVAPNYRGGVGYGDAFGKALRNDFGGVDYLDSISAVDEVIRLGIADPEKLAVTGGSWGGYLTNWTITQTSRFKAAVSLFRNLELQNRHEQQPPARL